MQPKESSQLAYFDELVLPYMLGPKDTTAIPLLDGHSLSQGMCGMLSVRRSTSCNFNVFITCTRRLHAALEEASEQTVLLCWGNIISPGNDVAEANQTFIESVRVKR